MGRKFAFFTLFLLTCFTGCVILVPEPVRRVYMANKVSGDTPQKVEAFKADWSRVNNAVLDLIGQGASVIGHGRKRIEADEQLEGKIADDLKRAERYLSRAATRVMRQVNRRFPGSF